MSVELMQGEADTLAALNEGADPATLNGLMLANLRGAGLADDGGITDAGVAWLRLSPLPIIAPPGPPEPPSAVALALAAHAEREERESPEAKAQAERDERAERQLAGARSAIADQPGRWFPGVDFEVKEFLTADGWDCVVEPVGGGFTLRLYGGRDFQGAIVGPGMATMKVGDGWEKVWSAADIGKLLADPS